MQFIFKWKTIYDLAILKLMDQKNISILNIYKLVQILYLITHNIYIEVNL